jgi:hypothetical protein
VIAIFFVLRPGKVGSTMRFRIVVATLLTAAVAYSQTGPSSVGTTPSPQLRSYTKTLAAKTRIKTSVDDFVLWIDETKWKQEKTGRPGMLKFSHVNGEAHALVISRSVGMPTTVLRDSILSVQKEADPNARITFEEKRTVNGRQVLATEMSGATEEGVPFRFFGYYHGGSSGSISIVGYTPETLFSKNIGEVTEFLNGLEISDQESTSSANRDVLPSPGLLLVNSRVSIKYDPEKWTQQGTDEVGHFTFMHSSGEGYAIVNQGRIPIPIDSFQETALSVLRSKDPAARIAFKEMRRVNDSDVLFLRFENDLNGVPMMNCGYFYSSKSGTVQVIAFARKARFVEFERDFMDFLNGLWISE